MFLMGNYNSRQIRLTRLSNLICDNFQEGEWFTIHDIAWLWTQRYPSCVPTNRELGKLVQGLGLESEHRKGHSYLFYEYNGKNPLYVPKERDW